jgi:choline dehydrogenase-like flavoprotein
MEERQHSSGRANLISTLRICRPARWRVRCAAPRHALSSIHPWLLGPCMEVSCAQKSRGQIRLTGPNPDDPIRIDANTLSHPDDLKAAVASVELCREIGNSASTPHQTRSHAWQPERSCSRRLHPRCDLHLSPSDVHRENGARFDVGRRRSTEGLWDRKTSALQTARSCPASPPAIPWLLAWSSAKGPHQPCEAITGCRPRHRRASMK